MAFKTLEAKSLAEYTSVVRETIEGWSDPNIGEPRLWYRGQSDARWGLVPGEYRMEHINADELRSEFQLKARPLLREVPQTEWEWYFLMQHHGLPTRLLDWTTGASLGLYFALREDVGGSDAAVWIIDPWAFNEMVIGRAELLMSSESKAFAYLPRLYSKKRPLPKLPIAILPPYNSARITVQRGTFTVHGLNRNGIDEVCDQRLVRVVVPKNAALSVKRELRTSGIGEFTVFPDLDGLCREICSVEIHGC